MSEVNTEQSLASTGGIPEISMEVDVYGMTQYPVDDTLSTAGMAADAKATGDAISAVAADLADLAADVSGIMEIMYPVGSIYMTTQSSVPETFAGTWTEIMMPMTWNDARNGTRGYTVGTGTGTVHYFLRTA